MKSFDAAGLLLGSALSPLTGLTSALRRSRMVHPSGVLCEAEVEVLASDTRTQEIAHRLAGPALVRCSAAVWKEREWIDLLGCAVRFTQAPLRAEALADDQDLLLATVKRPWSAPMAFLRTQRRDFMSNHYYSVSPFHAAPLGDVEWRIRWETTSQGAGSREERLLRAIASGAASAVLEWAPYAGALHQPRSESFAPLVRVRILAPSRIDQEALRFNPFRAGRGLIPYGLVHNARRATYVTSQAARPSRSALDPTASSECQEHDPALTHQSPDRK